MSAWRDLTTEELLAMYGIDLDNIHENEDEMNVESDENHLDSNHPTCCGRCYDCLDINPRDFY